MKKKMLAIALSSILLVGCGSTKPVSDSCCQETAVEKVVSKDPVMKLLASALIIYAIQILVTK
jgi:uncharacterized protein YcfL|tara:strand:- start:267 stop:455 length:189 start_codon:yes stop_codon:yes gene_type:complete